MSSRTISNATQIINQRTGLTNEQFALIIHTDLSKSPFTIAGLVINYVHRVIYFQQFIDNRYFSNLQTLLLQVTSMKATTMTSKSQQQQFKQQSSSLQIYFTIPPSTIKQYPSLQCVLQHHINEIQFIPQQKLPQNVQQRKTVIRQIIDAIDERQGDFNKTKKLFKDFYASDILSILLITAQKNLRLSTLMKGLFLIEPYHLGSFMKLDRACLNGLQILPSQQSTMDSKKMTINGIDISGPSSLKQFLNKCCTKSGQRLLHKWLLQPLINVHQINQRLDTVEFLVEFQDYCRDIRVRFLREFPDIEKVQFKFFKLKHNLGAKKSFSLFDAIKAQKIATQVIRLHQYMMNQLPGEIDSENQRVQRLIAEFQRKYVIELGNCISDEQNGTGLEKLLKLVENSITPSRIPGEQPYINPKYDQQMVQIYEQMQSVYKKIQDVVQDLKEQLNLSFVNIIQSAGHGLVMQTKKKELEMNARGSRLQPRIIGTKKLVSSFTTAKFQSLVQRYFALKSKYAEVQKSIVEKVIMTLATYAPLLQSVSNLISELDVLCSFAAVSANGGGQYVRPKIVQDAGKIQFKQMRHPLLTQMNVIKNDCLMRRKDRRIIIITGPNMGGKSTFIRMVAIGMLMGQIGTFLYFGYISVLLGCYVPCRFAQFQPVDAIISRVGASDSNLLGVSTFQNQMNQVANMLEVRYLIFLIASLQSATERSLTIIDQLGRGTSTHDGIGIAKAVGHELASEIKCYSLYATHFHQLAELQNELDCVANQCVKFDTSDDNNSIRMLYKIQDGNSTQSCGINVLKMLKFPKEIVQHAQTIYTQEMKKRNKVI